MDAGAARTELIAVLSAARELLARPDADYTWSSWRDAGHALAELDGLIAQLRADSLLAHDSSFLFVPTGPMQEVALSSGWGDAFLDLANRGEAALAVLTCAATFACSLCGKRAGALQLQATSEGGRIRRESFIGVLLQTVESHAYDAARRAISDGQAPALFAFDDELAPFWCPRCEAIYCGEHWHRWDVWDDDDPTWHDCIRGRCPQGHERMLQD